MPCTRYTFLFILLCIPFFALAQSPIPLTGQLQEAGTGKSLPFATVGLYALPDSNMVANALTEADGRFLLETRPGNYYALFQYVGYEDRYLSPVEVQAGQDTLRLGNVEMSTDAIALQEVEVKAERSQMEFKLDKRVFNVGKDLTNAGNNAADILDNVPSVSVDPEGNVSLRGSQGVRILINGQPSGLLSAGDTEALQRMQGDMIERVEVITNPSARYEAEGEAGIINIILKKEEKKGFNGSFGLTAGQPANYGASYNLNYRKRAFNFFSNFGLDYRRAPGGGNATQRFFENGELTNFFTSETTQNRGGLGGYLQMGTDYNFNERNTLTAALLYRTGEDDNRATVTFRDFDPAGNLLNTTVRRTDEVEEEHNLEATLNYERQYDNPDQKWTFNFKYILDDDTELADYRQTDEESTLPLLQRSSNTEDEINMLLQTDYIYPISESTKVEGGLRAAFRTVNNDFFVEEEGADGIYTPLPDFNDELEYTEDIYAAYAIGGHEFGPYSVQVGLRAELSDITAALLRSGESNDQDYLSFFPSASLSYSVTEKDQLQASYSRRLSRPYFRRLLPFSNYNNPRNNNIGNPNLRPEFTNSFEAGYLRYLENGTFLTSLYYRRTTGVIERLTLPADDGTAIIYPVNLAVRDAFGLELNLSVQPTDWWDITGDVNLFRAIIEGSFEGTDYSADTYTMSGQINSKVKPTDRWQVQVSFDYTAPQRTPQGRRLSIYMLDIAASLDVLDNRGTVTLSGRDLFNTRQRRSEVNLPDYEEESVFQWRRTQSVILAFNYRLNQEKRQERRQ
jgi:outer membrane receptor protein involved in Fe transport